MAISVGVANWLVDSVVVNYISMLRVKPIGGVACRQYVIRLFNYTSGGIIIKV